MASFEHRLDAATDQATLLAKVAGLNADPAVHGILVQLPLPPQIDTQTVIAAIDPAKDVDGSHVINAGRMITSGQGAAAPLVTCTQLGGLMLLQDRLGDLRGLHAVGVGPANTVDKTRTQPLLARSDASSVEKASVTKRKTRRA